MLNCRCRSYKTLYEWILLHEECLNADISWKLWNIRVFLVIFPLGRVVWPTSAICFLFHSVSHTHFAELWWKNGIWMGKWRMWKCQRSADEIWITVCSSRQPRTNPNMPGKCGVHVDVEQLCGEKNSSAHALFLCKIFRRTQSVY